MRSLEFSLFPDEGWALKAEEITEADGTEDDEGNRHSQWVDDPQL